MNENMSCILCASAALWALRTSHSALSASLWALSLSLSTLSASLSASILSTVACNIQSPTFKQCKCKVHV